MVGLAEPVGKDCIAALGEHGQPLPGSEQVFFSKCFDHPFANVRIVAVLTSNTPKAYGIQQ